MYLYLYDSFLVDQKYRKLIDRLETRLTDLGISGKTVRLTILKNAREVIKDNLREEIDTVVVIGSDNLLAESAMALAGTNLTLGFIPVNSSSLSQILDIPANENACDVVSGRRLEQIDLGRINGQYFLNSVQINTNKIEIQCDHSYQIKPLNIKAVKIVNLDWLNFSLNEPNISLSKPTSNARDGLLEILFTKKTRKGFLGLKTSEQPDSLFCVKRVNIQAAGEKDVMVKIDSQRIIKLPIVVETVPRCLKIIVGRNRLI